MVPHTIAALVPRCLEFHGMCDICKFVRRRALGRTPSKTRDGIGLGDENGGRRMGPVTEPWREILKGKGLVWVSELTQNLSEGVVRAFFFTLTRNMHILSFLLPVLASFLPSLLSPAYKYSQYTLGVRG